MLKIGSLFAERYTILAHIGAGGMADVYKATDVTTNEAVAIKILKPELSEDESFVSRFEVEGQAMASLNNQNVVRVYDIGRYRDTYYIIMEYVDGITLKDYIRRKGMLSPRETMAIASQAAVGLRSAHAKHIIHRDIKPQNVILSRSGAVKITDFGIAHSKGNDKNSLKLRGAMGSVHYIAPEQAKGNKCDERSDLYSLGICMYEMITGRVPFDKDTTVAVALAHMNESMVAPSKINPSCPLALEQIIFRCTQKSRERRYHNVTELLEDLKIAVNNPRHDFEKHEQQNLMMGDTQVFEDDAVEEVKTRDRFAEKKSVERFPERSAERNHHTGRPEHVTRNEHTEKSDKSEKNEKEMPLTATTFDRVIMILGIVFGALSLCMGIYIVASLTGSLQNSTIRAQTTTATQKDPMKDITVQTINESEYNSDKDTKVPNLLGKSVNEAIAALEEADLTYEISSLVVYSDEYTIGQVCKQSCNEGTMVEKGTTIMVALSAGSDKFEIKQEYIGGSLANFKSAIAKYADVITVTYKSTFSDNYNANVIMSITPSSGFVKSGDKVTVTYSLGSEYLPMPNIVGMTKAEAADKLDEYGFKMGQIEQKNSFEYDKGTVMFQQYEVGKSMKNGTTVNVIISSGPQMGKVVDVVGKQKTSAITLLEQEGFKTEVKECYLPEKETDPAKESSDPAASDAASSDTTAKEETSETTEDESSSSEEELPDLSQYTEKDYGLVVYMTPAAGEEAPLNEPIVLYVLTKKEESSKEPTSSTESSDSSESSSTTESGSSTESSSATGSSETSETTSSSTDSTTASASETSETQATETSATQSSETSETTTTSAAESSETAPVTP